MLQDYKRHVEQQFYRCKTLAYTAAIYLTTFRNCVSLLRTARHWYKCSCVALR